MKFGFLYLEVDTQSTPSINYNARHYSDATILMRFKRCPPGFTMQQTYNSSRPGFACECDQQIFSIGNNCSLNPEGDNTASIIKRSSAWIGVLELANATMFMSVQQCPLDYCDPERKKVPISSDNELQQDVQCQYNRTGIICGSCPEGWSMILGSSECRDDCSNISLLLILPFALAGILLVLIISCLDLTVTMGTINGLIFYANVMQDNYIYILAKHHTPVLTLILQIFLAWLNLDLGITTCFYRGMGAFDKTMLQGAFPVYLWLIALVITILSNKYVRVTHFLGENAVKVLATLILLSYSKLLRITITSFNYTLIRMYSNITGSVHMETKWIMDGNINYITSKYHISLFIMAVSFVIISFPFTLSLLCIKHTPSLSNYCKCFSCIDKLKPFFDAYTGPFKDRSRFCSF